MAQPFLPVWATAADPDNLSVFDPVSPPANTIHAFFILVLVIVSVIFVIVEGLILYCLIRFRGRRDDPGDPPQIFGSRPLELAWTLAPGLIVFILLLIVIRSVGEVRPGEPPPGAMAVTVVGHQWWWEYRYPDLGIVTANELHVPASDPTHARPVYLALQSPDVIHSYWVPRLAGKTDVIPGRDNRTWFQPLEEGIFGGQCTEYCGAQHANMMIRVYADPPEEFERWCDNQRQSAVADGAMTKARQAFLAQACVNCHTVRGTTAAGTFGPDLTHLMSRQTLASGMIANDHSHLAAWVNDPQTIKPGCNMPSLHLSSAQVDEIVAYLETLR